MELYHWKGVLISEDVVYRLQWSYIIGKVSSFQRMLSTGFNGVISIERCPHFRGCYAEEVRQRNAHA